MYVHVLFFLFTCVNIIKCKDTDSDEAKYIDLLPEEEKQEFLNRVAKRIFAEIKGQNRSDRTSVEISDEKLDEHDAYVQRIMEEETEKFKHKRRLGSQRKGDDGENENASEAKGNIIENENILGQDNTDVSVLKTNIRIKKDTNEDIKQTSMENRRMSPEDAFTDVPVPLLYDEESNLHKIVTAKNQSDSDELVNKHQVENHLKVEGLKKKSDKSVTNEGFENRYETSGLRFHYEDNSKEIIDAHNSQDTRNSYADYDDTKKVATSDVPMTLIDEFDPGEKSSESKINTTPKGTIIKSKIKTSVSSTTGKAPDLSNGKSFLLDLNSFKHIISSTPKVTEESVSPGRMNDTLIIIKSEKYTTHASFPKLRSELNSTESDIENGNVNGTEKLQENIQAAELGINPSNDNINKAGGIIILTTSKNAQENVSKGDSTTENIVQRDRNSEGSGSDLKQSLRYGNKDKEHVEYTFTPKYPFNSILAPSNENYKSHYHVFEVSNKNSIFVPSKQVNSELMEAPHHVPVYNYDPSNAFYTGYNYFGPNYGELDKTSEVNANDYIVYKKLNKQNFIPDYKIKKTKNNKVFQNNKNMKFYDSNDVFKSRSAVHQNHLLPAWKGGFSDISFNPNDYLDLDYYPGRTNEGLDTNEDDAPETSQIFFPQQLRHGISEDVVDPDASLEHYNIKDKIAALRNALYIHKYGKKSKISDLINKNNQLKTKFTKWKQNVDPILRGLDDTFLIFLPGAKGSQGAANDKNIAVDYYFSRMNSEEQSLSDSNETYYKPLPVKKTTTSKKIKLKDPRTLEKIKDENDKVISEKRIQIPLNPDNILKIDLAVNDGKNVNIIFRNVRKPEPDKFEAYLNSYMNVMKDMIDHDNKGLLKYQWLGTTVDIQCAIDKLLQLTKTLKAQGDLHYSDFELIKYILFVFQTSNKLIKEDADREHRSKNKVDGIVKATPRAVSHRAGGDVDESLKTLSKIYEDIKELQEMSVTMSDTALEEFEDFLLDLQSSLNKLHEAIKEIATITNYKKQNWFHDLKHLYLLPVDRNVSLSLLLHLATSKLCGVIEDSAKNGLEDNFIIFVRNHREEVERTRDDFIFVLRLLSALKKLEN